MMATTCISIRPAGHRPHKEGEYVRSIGRNVPSVQALLIHAESARGSPLLGEFAGRAEGGRVTSLNVFSQEA